MSTNNQRPWYRTPTIIIPAIAVIIAALIGGIFVLISSPQLPTGSTFKEIGGDTDTDGDYEISWERAIRATFYILQEDEDPSFTSPKTIYRGFETKKVIYGKSNGDYYYRVRACNDAGESEWSPIRKITVIISTRLTPSPMPTSTPTPLQPPLAINITGPSEGDKIPRSITVTGTISGDLPDNRYMWVVVQPHVSSGWWPQTGRIRPVGGNWYVQAWIGVEKDIGKNFDIAVILVNKDSDLFYQHYLERGKETGDYPEIPLQDDASIYDLITVTRR